MQVVGLVLSSLAVLKVPALLAQAHISQVFASSSHHKRFKQPYGENGDNTREFVALGNQCFRRMLELIELCRVLCREVAVEQPVRVSDACTQTHTHAHTADTLS